MKTSGCEWEKKKLSLFKKIKNAIFEDSKMNISILLRHSGIQEGVVIYERYKSDGIVVGKHISFMNFISAIAVELGVDESKENIEIRYVVEGSSSPSCIWTDMGLELYIKIKKHEFGFGTYPLRIDTSDKGVVEILNFDATTGVIVCVKEILNS